MGALYPLQQAHFVIHSRHPKGKVLNLVVSLQRADPHSRYEYMYQHVRLPSCPFITTLAMQCMTTGSKSAVIRHPHGNLMARELKAEKVDGASSENRGGGRRLASKTVALILDQEGTKA